MKVGAYNPQNGNLVAESITGLVYGNVRRGEHCDSPLLIKPEKTTENSFTEMKLFLQNNGGLDASMFGHFADALFASGVDYTNYLSDHFTLATGVTGTDYTATTGLEINITDGNPTDYVWLDVEVGASESGATSSINYRFVFEYN